MNFSSSNHPVLQRTAFPVPQWRRQLLVPQLQWRHMHHVLPVQQRKPDPGHVQHRTQVRCIGILVPARHRLRPPLLWCRQELLHLAAWVELTSCMLSDSSFLSQSIIIFPSTRKSSMLTANQAVNSNADDSLQDAGGGVTQVRRDAPVMVLCWLVCSGRFCFTDCCFTINKRFHDRCAVRQR